MLQLVPESKIAELEREEHERFQNMLDNHVESKEQAWKAKEQWLAIYARCLSPQIACDRSGISMQTYRRWRATDPKFCRALNRVIQEAHEEMVGSAYARATGYLKPDPESESGFEEDATGRPIRHGVSDRLAISLLQTDREDPKRQSVVVNLNFASMGLDPAAVIGHQPKPESLLIKQVDGEMD